MESVTFVKRKIYKLARDISRRKGRTSEKSRFIIVMQRQRDVAMDVGELQLPFWQSDANGLQISCAQHRVTASRSACHFVLRAPPCQSATTAIAATDGIIYELEHEPKLVCKPLRCFSLLGILRYQCRRDTRCSSLLNFNLRFRISIKDARSAQLAEIFAHYRRIDCRQSTSRRDDQDDYYRLADTRDTLKSSYQMKHGRAEIGFVYAKAS